MTYREESCSQVINRISEAADGRGIGSLQGQTYALQRRKLLSGHESGFGNRGWPWNRFEMVHSIRQTRIYSTKNRV